MAVAAVRLRTAHSPVRAVRQLARTCRGGLSVVRLVALQLHRWARREARTAKKRSTTKKRSTAKRRASPKRPGAKRGTARQSTRKRTTTRRRTGGSAGAGRYSPVAGTVRPVSMTKYSCPKGDYAWYRRSV